MAGPINLTEVDFQEIKDNLIGYLRSTNQFTDYDFGGSNLSIILNLLAYQAQLNSYSANLVANESFLYTSTIRKNVVANARQIGYVPGSARSAVSIIDFDIQLDPTDYPSGLPETLQIPSGMVFSTNGGKSNFTFNVLQPQVAGVDNSGLAKFRNIEIYEGSMVRTLFVVDKSDYNQRFILQNPNTDVTTLQVEVTEDVSSEETFYYKPADNLVETTKESRIYWINEIDRGFYELTFGDGLFGKELVDSAKIFVSSVVTNGPEGNGIQFNSSFNFVGTIFDSFGTRVISPVEVLSVSKSEGGSFPEEVSSIKFRAPREYAAQNRCVTTQDFDVLVRKVFSAIDDVYVVGGETLTPAEYGRVYITIKPSNSDSLSNITKNYIKRSLDPYRIASIDIVINDPEILNVEVDSLVYFDEKKTVKDQASITATVNDALNNYVISTVIPKFGGALSYSKILCVIDDADKSITRNNTSLIMRKDLKIVQNTDATYEVCLEQPVQQNKDKPTVYSTGFRLEVDNQIDERVFYFENDYETLREYSVEDPQIISDIYCFYINEFNEKVKVNFFETSSNVLKVVNVPFEEKNITPFGTVYHETGEIELGFNYKRGIKFVSTEVISNVIEIRCIPQNDDIIAKESLFLQVDVSKSNIRSIIDTQIAGS